MIRYVYPFFRKLISYERTPVKLTHASCLGIFIAFSPLIGFHWLLTIILAWTLRLNIAVIYAASHIINNPFTMVPIYLADYAVGNFVLQRLLGYDLAVYNPYWMDWLNLKLACLGISNLSLWTFLIGGHLLAFGISMLSYPFLLHFYKRILPGRMTV